MSRFTIGGAMIAVLVVGLDLAAVTRPSPLLASLAWTTTLTLLLVAALVAALDPRRAFWVGFAVVGLGYAVFAAGDSPTRSSLLTSYATSYWIMTYSTFMSRITWASEYADLMLSVHALSAFVHAVTGGLLATWLRSRLLRDLADRA